MKIVFAFYLTTFFLTALGVLLDASSGYYEKSQVEKVIQQVWKYSLIAHIVFACSFLLVVSWINALK